MFKVARQLLAHRNKEDTFALSEAVLDDCGRAVPLREIRDAILAAEPCRWRPRHAQTGWQAHHRPTWPVVDLAYRDQILTKADRDLYDLWEASPLRLEDNEAEG